MSYQPPTGRELQLLQDIQAVNRAKPHLFSAQLSIRIGHAIEGVRMNGRLRLNSIHYVYADALQERKDAQAAIQRAEHHLSDIEAATACFLADVAVEYDTCPVCNGKGGEESKAAWAAGGREWNGCGDCNEQGLVPKEATPC